MTGKIQIRLAVLAALAALTAVLVPAGLASGTHGGPDHPDISTLDNVGVLRLTLNGTDEFRYQAWNNTTHVYEDVALPSGAGGQTVQAVGPPVRCELSEAAGNLAQLSSVSGMPGQDGDDIGIRVNGPRGTPCGQVDSDEGALSLRLAGDLVGYVMDYVEVDIEGKHDVAVSVQAYLNDIPIGSPQEVIDCEVAADVSTDCGPDSADNDNFRVVIALASSAAAGTADATVPTVFNRLDFVVSSTDGEFSLNGGADGTTPGALGTYIGTTDSLFHITNVPSTTCNAPQTVGTPQVFGGSYTIYGCTEKNLIYILDPTDNRVSIINIGAHQDVYSTEAWTFNPALPTNVFEYDDTDDDTDNFRTGLFCVGDPREDNDFGDPVGTDPSGTDNGVFDPSIYLPAPIAPDTVPHTTCIIVEQLTAYDATRVVPFYVIFSVADASRRFG